MGNKIAQGSATGRVAVITGGASGIGLGVAEQCSRLKMKICIADLDRQGGLMKDIEPRLRSLGAQDVMFHGTDVAKVELLREMGSDPNVDASAPAFQTEKKWWWAGGDVAPEHPRELVHHRLRTSFEVKAIISPTFPPF